jgi:hypothetical protein
VSAARHGEPAVEAAAFSGERFSGAPECSLKLRQPGHIERVLGRIAVLRHPCDLDLLLFFLRHPRTLLTSDQIATFLGYDVKQLGASLDVLLTANLLTRVQRTTSAPRMYVLSAAGPHGGSLSSLLDLASTRDGRLALRAALTARQAQASADPPSRRKRDQIAKAS